jgi:hypothetical protein
MELSIIISKRPKFTAIDTIATYHATTIIHAVCLKVDTSSLAILGAKRTVLALILIEAYLQP